jgi:UDP-glucose 4-epimerase
MSESLAGRTVLVTGGLGFIGSALVRALAAAGARVRVLDSLLPQGGGTPRHLDGTRGDITVTIEDTRSRDVVNQVVAGCDLAFHLAGHDGISALAQDWLSEIDIACIGTLHVLDAVRVYAPRAHVVFASASAVYGQTLAAPVAEDAPTNPASLFGVHKLAGEKYCGVYRAAYGVRSTVARLGTVFGPGQRLRGAATDSLASMLDAALHDEPVLVRHGGGALMDVLHVDDVVVALLALGARPDDDISVINVGRGQGVTTLALAEAVIAAAGEGRVELVGIASARGGVVMDIDLLRTHGFASKPRALDEALLATVAWYRGASRAP